MGENKEREPEQVDILAKVYALTNDHFGITISHVSWTACQKN